MQKGDESFSLMMESFEDRTADDRPSNETTRGRGSNEGGGEGGGE